MSTVVKEPFMCGQCKVFLVKETHSGLCFECEQEIEEEWKEQQKEDMESYYCDILSGLPSYRRIK